MERREKIMCSYEHGLVVLVTFLWAAGSLGGQRVNSASRPPEGNAGIAARYPNDVGIEKDPAVVFVDDFENGNLRQKWNKAVWQAPISRHFTDVPANVHGGQRAVEFVLPQGSKYGHGATKRFAKGYDVLFVRYYVKFDKDVDFYNSAHDGVSISAIAPEIKRRPGVRADGRNYFSASLDTWRWRKARKPPSPPGEWVIYSYHPDQRGDYGDNFYPRPKFMVQRNRWYCCELMLKANTPGKRDGHTAFWVDGRLVGSFPELRLRDVDSLKINQITITFYIGNNEVRANRMWYDDLVAATSYIGPIFKGKPADKKPKKKLDPPVGW